MSFSTLGGDTQPVPDWTDAAGSVHTQVGAWGMVGCVGEMGGEVVLWVALGRWVERCALDGF